MVVVVFAAKEDKEMKTKEIVTATSPNNITIVKSWDFFVIAGSHVVAHI